jgi:hypothetical protein
MRSTIQRVIEAALCAVILGLLILLAVPWHRQKSDDRSITTSVAHTASADAPGLSPSLLPIETVLLLFTDRRGTPAPRATAAPAPAATPTDAPWLKYLGFASGADGTSWWYLKDSRTGKLIKVQKDKVTGGWSVIENSTDRLVVRNGDSLYSVSKR